MKLNQIDNNMPEDDSISMMFLFHNISSITNKEAFYDETQTGNLPRNYCKTMTVIRNASTRT